MQRSNEAAIQSDYQTTIGSRSHTGKTALTSARGDRCRFVLERRSRCNPSGASQLFHRPHVTTQSYFAANRQIDAETCRLAFSRSCRSRNISALIRTGTFVFINDFFSDERHFRRSSFYRGCIVPINGRCAIGLFFWESRRLLAAIIVVRSEQQGELSPGEVRVIGHLHSQFQTALHRLHSRSRERAVRVALEQFMRRLPLPTVLLRWNLRLAYRNQAGAESCAVWQRGPLGARFIKIKAPIPPEILNQCRVLKKRWEQLSPLSLASANLVDETVRHPTRCDLRATISLKQTSSAAFARPHFLIEFEDLRGSSGTGYQASLSHLVRLTIREQNLARLVCDGRSNQEIADESGLSLETVKKHLHSIYCKLQVPSRSRLMALMR